MDTSPSSPSLEGLFALTDSGMAEVNQCIHALARGNTDLIEKIAEHLIDAGGKRLRPMLTLAAAGAFAYTGNGHIMLAAAVEFMHTATLLHDDVVDESAMRRGKPAARMIFGNQASVLVGDYLLGQAFRMMVEVGSLAALEVLARAAAVIAEGEVMQLAAARDLGTDEALYLRLIDAKTAALFAAACEVGPILAGSTETARRAMALYGQNLGLVFQLIDDVLDYGGSSQHLGKRVGDDFREGKMTLPVILALRAASPAEQAFWRRALQGGDIREGDLEEALHLLSRHGALQATVEKARFYCGQALKALENIPASPYREALAEAVRFALNRAQ